MFETIAALTYADTANRILTTFFCFVTSHSPCFTCCHDKHDVTTRACVQCWRNYEYFMLKRCLENIGEGLLHACISSNSLCCRLKEFRSTFRINVAALIFL